MMRIGAFDRRADDALGLAVGVGHRVEPKLRRARGFIDDGYAAAETRQGFAARRIGETARETGVFGELVF